MSKNLDCSWGVNTKDNNFGAEPNWHKIFILGNKEQQLIKHYCLYEGISGYLKTEDHVIICQITRKGDKHTGIEDTPTLNPYYKSTPRVKLSEGQKIWRYMSFYKFLDLINTSNLHFSRIDQFKDKLEGISPESCKKAILNDKKDKDKILENIRLYEKRLLNNRRISYACCWHINNNLNYEIWNEYGGKSFESIAIQTNLKSLNNELKKAPIPIINEPIRYFNNPFFNQEAYWFPTFFKRKEYSNESELRSIFYLPGEHDWTFRKINIKLENLINKIYVHPKSDKHHFKKIKDTIKEKGLNIQVVKKAVKQK